MRVRFSRWWRLVLPLVAGLPAAGAAAGPERPIPAALAPAEIGAALLAETNAVRRAHGRRPLRPRAELAAAADDQAAFMALVRHAQHGSPLPGQTTAFDRVRRHGGEGVAVAENVAAAPVGGDLARLTAAAVARELVQQWLESPPHRANLLDPGFTHFGGAARFGRLPGDRWCAYGVQVFLIALPPPGRVSGRGAAGQ